MFEKVIAWGKAHPYMLGGIVFGVGLLLLWWFGFFSKSASQQSTGVADYYAAQTAGAVAAGNLAQSNNATEAAIAGTTAARDVGLAQTEAARQIGLAQIDTGGKVALGTAAITAEVADAQTASALATGMHYIDYLTNASRDAVQINASNNSAAVTTSAQAAHVAEGQTIAGIITSPTGLLQTEQAPASLGILAARLWGAFTGASNSDPNVGYPTGSVVPGVGFVPVDRNIKLQTIPMSNGPTDFTVSKFVPPDAPNVAAEKPGIFAASTMDFIASKIAAITTPSPVSAPSVSYSGKA